MKHALFAAVLVVMMGCATEIRREPASLTAPAMAVDQRKTITVNEEAVVFLSSGYTRKIRAGTVWRESGTLDGRVAYRAIGEVFTIEGSNVHEAYLLLDGNTVVGFYLPGEKAVSWLERKVDLNYH
jgi:hypothetical protein